MQRLDGTTIIGSYVVTIFAELFEIENEDVNMTIKMNVSTVMRIEDGYDRKWS